MRVLLHLLVKGTGCFYLIILVLIKGDTLFYWLLLAGSCVRLRYAKNNQSVNRRDLLPCIEPR